jgi:hypothetical protein
MCKENRHPWTRLQPPRPTSAAPGTGKSAGPASPAKGSKHRSSVPNSTTNSFDICWSATRNHSVCFSKSRSHYGTPPDWDPGAGLETMNNWFANVLARVHAPALTLRAIPPA